MIRNNQYGKPLIEGGKVIMKNSVSVLFVSVFTAAAGVLSPALTTGGYAAETKIEGVLFTNYSVYTSHWKTTNARAYGYNVFDVGRAYVTAATKFTPNLASKIVLEANTLTVGNNAFLKNAFLQWKDDADKFTVEGGMPGTLWVGAEEAVWKYRFVEKTQADLEGVLNASDKGVKVIYKLPKGFGTAEAMLSNGEGYKTLENTDYKGYGKDEQIRLSLTPILSFKELSVSGFYLGSVFLPRTRERFAGGIAYQGKKFSLGASTVKSLDYWTTYASSSATIKQGYSVYGNLPLTSSLSIFARLDHFDNSRLDTMKYDKKTLLLAGAAYELAQDVKVALTERRSTQGQATVRRKDQNIVSLDLMAKF